METAERKFKYNYTVRTQSQITGAELTYNVNFDLEGNVSHIDSGWCRWYKDELKKGTRCGAFIIATAKKQREKEITANYITMKVKQGNRTTDNLKQGGR